jgi:hypothetical protein
MPNFQGRLGLVAEDDLRTPYEVLSDLESCIADVLACEVESSDYRTRGYTSLASGWSDGDKIDFQCIPEDFIEKMLSRASWRELEILYKACEEIFDRLNDKPHVARSVALMLRRDQLALEVDSQRHAKSRAFEVADHLDAARKVVPLARALAPRVLSPTQLVVGWVSIPRRREPGTLGEEVEDLLLRAKDALEHDASLRALATAELFTPTARIVDALDRPVADERLEANVHQLLAKFRLPATRKAAP